MRPFTLKQLRYFVVAGELSSVTQAARKLHVSQPSISAAIHQIEEATGLQLFVRHHAQGLSLTPTGRQLLTRARQLLRDAEGLEKFAASLGEEVGGELRLVAFPTFAPLFLPQLLRQFADRHPAVSLYCDEMTQVDIVNGLQQGDYELAFTYDLEIPDDIAFIPLYRFPAYAVVAEDHPLSEKDRIGLAELATYPMVLLDWPLSREYFLSIFSHHQLLPHVAHRAKSMDMLRGLLANGFGFSLFNTPMSAFSAADNARLKALALEDDAQPLTMGLACLRGLRLSPAADAMRQLAQEIDTITDVFGASSAVTSRT
ncbi:MULTISPECIES: LysR family transcriptional regulator [unclassified Halomonas]|uniref:LysR family transcriptional regulator n=1 Tax=unclassified Halomonas TaxID=2609666 RepID=UPI001C9554C5|nr:MULTISPECIES: LysR family transcriptional regulator [unclassified Halomonas]MED5294728.1 LysR family transcriptional regulator [Pseudomonadota bacterium]MBY5924750.1 LysR family transcriptional regulator [Halomonas sp. DP4Y7-2]MBY5929526.1 LysR family transcriptional regulator [Halomonas sp. DP8Y7-3]MBY5983923.1 LysR family transcriptional regulator [Halomonas sp. DP5Y7-2]MBY6028495.1 LysR family transcriptional regulator [Halomonas sp. DP8Y7-1]